MSVGRNLAIGMRLAVATSYLYNFVMNPMMQHATALLYQYTNLLLLLPMYDIVDPLHCLVRIPTHTSLIV